jgi:hypothetical protein
LCLALSCDRKVERTEPKPLTSVTLSAAKPASAPPTRLVTLPISAYGASLALDDGAIFLLTSKAAYRFASGEPDHGIALDLGLGPVLTRSAFVFWSSGAIWSAPKQGGVARKLAPLSHQPQYFVASGDEFAWVDLSETGLYTIQILEKQEPRVLVLSAGEISGLNMVGGAIYFVQRPSDDTWRIGVVRARGGEVEYSAAKKGRRPAMLSGNEQIYYYSLDSSEIRALSLDLSREQVVLRDLVCSPIQVSTSVYCGCVEGLFEVSRETGSPRVLVQNRPGSITTIASNEKQVAWVVDAGPDLLAVDVLRLPANR